MHNEYSGRDLAHRAQEVILRIRDVRSCRVVTDGSGAVSEIHVVSTGDRQPKMIARDVVAILKVELDLDVDYRKIGVVLMDREPGEEARPASETPAREAPRVFPWDEAVREAHSPPAGEEASVPTAGEAGLEIVEDFTRIGYRGFKVTIDRDRVTAEVTLARDGLEVTGSNEGERGGPVYAAIARAAVRALAELLDEDFRLCLSEIREIELTGRKALIAVVDVVGGREAGSFSGCAFAGADPNEAAVLAVLDAVNRPFGRWKSRREIHYRIR